MIGVEAIDDRVSLVPTVDFIYPDEGDEPAPRVRDEWVESPLLEKCAASVSPWFPAAT